MAIDMQAAGWIANVEACELSMRIFLGRSWDANGYSNCYQRKLGSNFRVTNDFLLGAIDYDEGW